MRTHKFHREESVRSWPYAVSFTPFHMFPPQTYGLPPGKQTLFHAQVELQILYIKLWLDR